MPTQQEIEYFRNRHQRMNKQRFYVANLLALVTHTLTQPFDLVKVRSMMLQEGKTFNGLGLYRGYNPYQLFSEISEAGGGYKTWFTSLDGFLARTFTYTTARISAYLYFLDLVNHDPRRYPRPDRQIAAGVAGGFVAGFVTNPIEIVFMRMQVDEIYPKEYRRNYTSLVDGLTKTAREGALFRGSIANGGRIAGLISGAVCLHDWFKENAYYFLGPHSFNRLLGTIVASTVATLASMPFDTLRTRLYTQRQLPNGVWPYEGTLDCFSKICRYEANIRNHSNFQSFYAGAFSYWARFFVIAYASQILLDFYHHGSYVEELWEPAQYSFPTSIAFNVYEPFTLAYHKGAVGLVTEDMEESAGLSPDLKPLKVV